MKYFSLRQQWILIGLALFLLGITYFRFYYHSPLPPGEITNETVVELQGEVRRPGVHIFRHFPTLKEAIDQAGGLYEKISQEPKSFSEILETGTLITIQKVTPSPLAGEGKGEGEIIKIKMDRMAANKLLVFSIPLDLNRVSVEDLCLVPGIGESLAQEIVAYRKRRNAFRSVEELEHVKGIGDKKYSSLKKFFTVRP